MQGEVCPIRDRRCPEGSSEANRRHGREKGGRGHDCRITPIVAGDLQEKGQKRAHAVRGGGGM
jgi:hypothetical protein